MRFTALAIALTLAASASVAQAFTISPSTTFTENFEGDLSQWIWRDGTTAGITEAAITADPLNAGNQVLGFPKLGSGGSLYSASYITTSGQFTVSFDYLGLPKAGSIAGDLGGFFGISQGLPGDHQWIAGTGSYPAPIDLIDDGQWHTYTLTFTSTIGQTVRLMFEDFAGSGGVTGDVFFDNVKFNDSTVANDVPEPSSLALLGIAGVLAAATRRKTRR